MLLTSKFFIDIMEQIEREVIIIADYNFNEVCDSYDRRWEILKEGLKV